MASGKLQRQNAGDIVYSQNNSAAVEVENGSAAELSTLNLPSGHWVVIGCVDWQANANGYRQASFYSGTNPVRNGAVTAEGLDGKETYQQIVTIAGGDTTITLYGRQNSGVSINAHPYLYAIRIS